MLLGLTCSNAQREKIVWLQFYRDERARELSATLFRFCIGDDAPSSQNAPERTAVLVSEANLGAEATNSEFLKGFACG